MKKFKKLLAILLVASMIFTTNAVNVFAEGNKANQEEQLNEESEETTVGAEEESVGAEEESIGAKLGEPEEEAEETTVGANEESVGAKLGEPEAEAEAEAAEELELKGKKDDILYGDDPLVAYVYYIQYDDSTKKWEKKYATIAKEDDADEKVAALWNTPNTPFKTRFAIGYKLNPSDPGVPDLDLYNQFETTGSMYDQGSIIDEINSWKNEGPTVSLHICVAFHKCQFYFFRLVSNEGSGIAKEHAGAPEGMTDEEFNTSFQNKFNNMYKQGARGFYTFEAAEPMYPSDDDYNEYKTGDIEYECTLDGLKEAYDAWNDNPTKNICVGVMYAAPSAPPYMYWIVDGDGDNKTIHYYASATDGDGRTAVDFDENGVVYTSLSDDERNSIKKAVFEEPIVATDVRSYFKDFEGLVSITDIEKLDISNVTSLADMFGLLKSVETLDLTSFDTSKVTDMTAMFADCVKLTTISVSKNFKVNQVTESENMFKTCIKIVGSKGTKYNPKSYDKTYALIDRGTVKPGYFTGDQLLI